MTQTKFQTISNFQRESYLDLKWVENNAELFQKRLAQVPEEIFDLDALKTRLLRSVRQAKGSADTKIQTIDKEIRDLSYKKEELEKLKGIKHPSVNKIRQLIARKLYAKNRFGGSSVKLDEALVHETLDYAKNMHHIQAIHANKANWSHFVNNLLNKSPNVAKGPRSFTLDLLHSIKFNVNRMEELSGIKLPDVPKEIMDPPEFNFKWFNYNIFMLRPDKPDMRYIPNFSYHKFRKRYGDQIPSISLAESMKEFGTDLRIRRAIHILMRDYVSEARTVYIDKVIRGLIEATRSIEPTYELSPVTSPALYYMHKLLEPYDDWPYLESKKEIRYTDQNMSSNLPSLIYALCNLHVHYILGNVDTKMCIIAADTYMSWAKINFNQEHLSAKSSYTTPFKLLNEKVKNPVIPIYSTDGEFVDTRVLKDTTEIWSKDEKAILFKMLDNTTPLYKTEFLKRYENGFDSLLELTKFKVACGIVANPGNYKKTAPILELYKSVDPKTINPVAYGKPVTRVIEDGNEYVYQCDWSVSEYLELIWREFLINKPEIMKNLKLSDLTHEYFYRLTNKSAGKTLTDDQLGNLPKEFREYTKQRLFQALIKQEVLFDETKFKIELQERGKCGIRTQIDRRLRIIEIVNNTVQALSLLPLLIGEALADTTDGIASGKQVGDIRDMIMQLTATADIDKYVSSLDISGADASTQKSMGDMIYYACMHCLSDMDVGNKYFWAHTKEMELLDVEKGHTTRRILSGVEIFIMKSLSCIKHVNFELLDGVFGNATTVSGYGFWSGLYHTATHHNFNYYLLLASLLRKWMATRGKKILVKHLSSGDDILIVITSDNIDEVLQFIKYVINAFDQFGLETTSELSRWSGVFLQQEAHFGVVRPKPDRLSLVCSEKMESVGRSLHDQFIEIKSMLQEVSPRSVYPENSLTILRAMFNVSRYILYKWSNEMPYSFYGHKIISTIRMVKYMTQYIDVNDAGIIIIVPYVYLFHSECLSSPIPKMLTEHGVMDHASYLMPEGDIAEVLIRMLYTFTENDIPDVYEKLKQRQYEIKKQRYEKLTNKKPVKFGINDVYVKQFSVLNNDALLRDGWTFSQFMARVMKKEVLQEMRANIFDETGLITTLTAKLQQYQDQKKIHTSSSAYSILINNGIRIKQSIIYARAAKERIVQSLMEKPANEEETRDLTKMTIISLLSFTGKYLKHKNEGMMNVNFKYVNEKVKPSREYHFNKKVPLIPGAYPGSDTSNILAFTNTVLNKTVGGKIFYSKIDNTAFQGLRIEDVIKEGARVFRKGAHFLDIFFDSVGVDEKVREKLRRLIIDAANFGTTGFNTVLKPRLYFMINVHPDSYADATKFSHLPVPTMKSRAYTTYLKVLARDYILTFGHLNPSMLKLDVEVSSETLNMIRYSSLLA